EEALGCFDRAMAINPWHVPALYEKGACLLFLGHFDAAAACIDEVARLQPGPAVEAARRACEAGRERQPMPASSSWDGHRRWTDVVSYDGAEDDPPPAVPPTRFEAPPTGPDDWDMRT